LAVEKCPGIYIFDPNLKTGCGDAVKLPQVQWVGTSRMAVRSICREHRLKPHLVEGFKTSNDPLFAEKLRDVVEHYLGPPEKAKSERLTVAYPTCR
jgi:hypothetical protein